MLEVEESVRSELLSLGVFTHCSVKSGVDARVQPLNQIETTQHELRGCISCGHKATRLQKKKGTEDECRHTMGFMPNKACFDTFSLGLGTKIAWLGLEKYTGLA